MILVGRDGAVSEGTAEGARIARSSRKLFDVNASDDSWAADVQRAREFGALATAAQLIGAGQAMLDLSVQYAKQRSQFGGGHRLVPTIKHKLADVHIALELAGRWCTAPH